MPRLHSEPPADRPDHQPHVHRPDAAPAGHEPLRPGAGRGAPADASATRWPARRTTSRSTRTSSTTPRARPTTTSTTASARSRTRRRSARPSSTRPTRSSQAEYEGRPQTDRFGAPTGAAARRPARGVHARGRVRRARRLAWQIDSILTGHGAGRPDPADHARRSPTRPATVRTTTASSTRSRRQRRPASTTLTVPARRAVQLARQPVAPASRLQPGAGVLEAHVRGRLRQRARGARRLRGALAGLNLALSCGQNTTPTEPGVVGSCRLPDGFKSVNVRRRGKGLRILFTRKGHRNPVRVEVFQTSKGRTIYNNAKRRRATSRAASAPSSGAGTGQGQAALQRRVLRPLPDTRRQGAARLPATRRRAQKAGGEKLGFYLVDQVAAEPLST